MLKGSSPSCDYPAMLIRETAASMSCVPPSRLHRVITALAILAGALLAGPASAHGVRHQIQYANATVISLSYDDGQALAHAVFEAAPMGAAQAAVTGLTDAEGRAVIVADVPGRWRLRAFSNDGHGAVVEFDVTASAASAVDTIPVSVPVPRWMRAAFGLALLFFAFSSLQCWLRERRRRADPDV